MTNKYGNMTTSIKKFIECEDKKSAFIFIYQSDDVTLEFLKCENFIPKIELKMKSQKTVNN